MKLIIAVIISALTLVGCGSAKAINLNSVTPWEKVEEETENQEILDEGKKYLEVIISQYKNGDLKYLRDRVREFGDMSFSTNKNYMADKEVEKFIGEKTEIEILEGKLIEGKPQYLLKIKWPNMFLSYFKDENRLKVSGDVPLKSIKDSFVKNEIWEENIVMLTYNRETKLFESDEYVKKVFTGGIVDPGIKAFGKDLETSKKIEERLIMAIEALKENNLTEFLKLTRNVPNIPEELKILKEKKEFLTNPEVVEIKRDFLETIKLEVMEGTRGRYRVLVKIPDYDEIINPLILENKSTNEILTELLKKIKRGKVNLKNEILTGEVYIDEMGVDSVTSEIYNEIINLGIYNIDRLLDVDRSSFERLLDFN